MTATTLAPCSCHPGADAAAQLARHDALYATRFERCIECPRPACGERVAWDEVIEPACWEHCDSSRPHFPARDSHGAICECDGCQCRRVWQANRVGDYAPVSFAEWNRQQATLNTMRDAFEDALYASER